MYATLIHAQTSKHPAYKLVVKSNVLNLLAKKPSVTIERPLSGTLSGEISYVQGEYTNVLFTDYYSYRGFLFRLKKYLKKIEKSGSNAYAALYVGNLDRSIYTTRQTFSSNGYLSNNPRDFTGNSIRLGAGVGLMHVFRNRLVLDWQNSFGYGIYYKQLDKLSPSNHSSGYLDAQLWLSVGYLF